MRKYIVASHSNFAKGLEEALNFFTAKGNEIEVISAYVEDNNFPEQKVKQMFDSFDKNDEVIVLTDLLAGSVNQKLSKYTGKNIYVITGVNLSLALSLLLIPETTPLTDQLVQKNIDQAKDQIVLMNTYSAADDDDE